jgi:tetratricopeptide (TPR) repeat protein
MRTSGLILIALVLVAAAANLAAQLPRGGSMGSLMGRLGLLNENRLAEQAYHELWAGNLGGQTGAVRQAQRALVSDMASSYRWCDLGEAFIEANDEGRAKYCLRRAIELGPKAPQILMRAANAYFRLGDSEAALNCSRRILAIVPVYDQVLFSTYGRMGIGVDQALAEGLPPNDSRVPPVFLDYVLSQHSIEDARKVWAWALSKKTLTDDVADRYVAALADARRYQEALDSWESYLGPRADRDAGNRLFNGGFERDPVGATFDWRIDAVRDVHVERDSKVAYAGRSALRIDFGGNENVAFRHVRQTVLMPPGAYRFEARVRAEGITTDQGLALRIHDAMFADRLRAQTHGVVGTTDWVLIGRDVTIPPPARLMTIEIARDPSEKFDSAIAGRAWVDNVRIVRRGSEAGSEPPPSKSARERGPYAE